MVEQQIGALWSRLPRCTDGVEKTLSKKWKNIV
jgi:hypothetical protein